MAEQAVAIDYDAMEWNELSGLARERGIKLGPGRGKKVIIKELRIQDDRRVPEIEAETGEIVEFTSDKVDVTFDEPKTFVPDEPVQAPLADDTTVKVVNHTRDAVRIVDARGNCLCLVYRVGERTGKPDGERFLLPLEQNAQCIVKALNRFRASGHI